MKKLIIAIVVIIIVAVLVVSYLAGLLTPASSVRSPSPAPTPTISPTPSPSSTPTLSPTPEPTSTAPAPAGKVTFGFVISDISGTGLSRTVTAQTTNTGAADAHNVWAEVSVTSGGAPVKVSGQDKMRVDIGTIAAAQTATSKVTLTFGITEGLKIAGTGATIKLVIHSDEYTETFTYDYKP